MKGLNILIILVTLALSLTAQVTPAVYVSTGEQVLPSVRMFVLVGTDIPGKSVNLQLKLQMFTGICQTIGSSPCDEEEMWATESVEEISTDEWTAYRTVGFKPTVAGAYYRVQVVRLSPQGLNLPQPYEWVENLPFRTAGLNYPLAYNGPPVAWSSMAHIRVSDATVTVASGSLAVDFEANLGLDTTATGYFLQIVAGGNMVVVPANFVATTYVATKFSKVRGMGFSEALSRMDGSLPILACIRPDSSTLTSCGVVYDPFIPGSAWVTDSRTARALGR